MADLGVDDIAVVGVAKGPDRDAGLERFFIAGPTPFMLEPQDRRCSTTCSACATRRTASPSAATGRAAAIDMKKNPLDEIEGRRPGPQAGPAARLRLRPGEPRLVADLMTVDGVSEPLAQRIHAFFRKG